MNNIGKLDAPDVTIQLNQEIKKERTTIKHIINYIQQNINSSIKIKPITEINNHVQFNKNNIKKDIFVTTSESGVRGFTPNYKWEGEALFFLKTEEGSIKINFSNYKVYAFSLEEYESLKNKKQSGTARFQEEWNDNLLTQSEFEDYFK